MEEIYCRPDCALSPTCFFSNPQWNFMCYYTKVYFNIIPTIHKKYRKQNKQPKRKLVRQIILEINSLDMQTHRNFLLCIASLLFWQEYQNICCHQFVQWQTFIRMLHDNVQSNLSYVTLQGNSEIWSHKTGGRLIQV